MNITNQINNLEKSLLFNLSLSSKELFHSNMIYWICNNYKDDFGKILSSNLCNNNHSSIQEVHREKNNNDLSIVFLSGQKIIFENKVKSIPNAKQLNTYKNKIEDNNTKFVLLSLIPPAFNPNDIGWEYISYNELAQIIKEFLEKYHNNIDKFHQLALNDYVEFITNLSGLSESLEISIVNDSFNFKGETYDMFHKIRLHDIYIKYKYTQLMHEIGNFLKNRISREIIIAQGYNRAEKDKKININFNLVRGKGVINIEYYRAPDLFLGLMIDGDRYNHFIYADKTFEEKKFKIADSLKENMQWFTPSFSSEEYSYPKNKPYNYFGEMIYRAAKIPNSIRLKELIEMIFKDTEKMIEISDNL